ncbi:EAL domain-containing protein [Acinetobacter sp. ANC 4216]|uniref:EAL domain-containing protein n=1 Tax=unclassified Acinetobacter TaxID=196816 RepID=UPI00103FD069|nr:MULTISPECIES: EAL domain-containing protein [unclassified Acinetobacter]MCT8090593.1 EAL domain-containing protein [Acinetobacter sp. F_3_1]MCT8099029.1 EAL domain-containing protein [Acinetobacter sp. C_3_1]MCT8101595.1 EAL domain-containing protein [Acinetobacter sp. C_4_1]MCT8135070.1 EAL domain-containing protein [Acinetobacter sp. T_3_1]TCB71250.1 EAL domain-containing protein [Acinetobacter sp. ANC 4216]
MGSIEVRNPLLSKKLKRTETRLLIIDDNQIRFNQIRDLLTSSEHVVHATLLDDLQNFEKQLHHPWDLVIFGRAYDLKYEQALSLIRLSKQPNLPMILLKPDDYQADQYAGYIRKGVYDILNLDYPDRFYLGLLRALSLSRLVLTQQHLMEELETAQTHAQSLVQESNKAIALIQEGIHVQANPEYLALFGIKNEDEIVGLPLLDLLQPKDLNDFKLRFKKISQGQFDLGRFEINSLNDQVSIPNPLKIEFLPSTDEEDAVQITVDIDSSPSAQAISPTDAPKPNTYQLINRTITQQPSDINALVLFSLTSCPDSIFEGEWDTFKKYFSNIKEFLKEQTHVPLFEMSSGIYVALFQAESKAKLESKLIGLSSLKKPQLLSINQTSYPLNLRIGYTLLDTEIRDEKHFEQFIASAYKTVLPENQPTPALELETPLAIPSIDLHQPEIKAAPSSPEAALLRALQQSLDRGEIHLKYQQLYDKQDTNLYTYEVTSGFIYENTWRDLAGLRELAEDPELSIKLDRWILVESCKQLHNFITQYPEARLIVNLNKAVLLHDRTFPEFISKLITIVRSKLKHPLILQFSEEDISQNISDAQKYIAQLRQFGAEVSLRDFGNTIYSESMLRQLDVNCLTLHQNLTKMLQAEKTTQELQEKLSAFQEIKPGEIMLRDLNDMTLFANAWNVDARFIQGDYFQKKLDHLIDVQDQ